MDIEINDYDGAPFCTHNYPCPIHPDQPAVYIMHEGRFDVSHKARNDGWRMIKLNNRIKRFVFKIFFE